MSVKGNTRKHGENTGEMGGHRRSVDQRKGVLKCIFSRMLKLYPGSLLAVLFRIKTENRTGNGDTGKHTQGNLLSRMEFLRSLILGT